MIIFILILSFLLDFFLLSIIKSSSILFPLCSLMSLIIIYPFFKKRDYDKFLIICLISGTLYDVVFTGTLFLNIGIFLLVGLIIKIIFRSFSNNPISNILTGLFVIVIYRTISYLIFCLSGNLDFSILELVRGIYSSLMVNLIYITIVYFLGLWIGTKFKIQRFS